MRDTGPDFQPIIFESIVSQIALDLFETSLLNYAWTGEFLRMSVYVTVCACSQPFSMFSSKRM